MFICTHCGEISAQNFKRAGNATAWAVGSYNTNNQFTVRRVVWGLLHAQYEKRADEIIKACLIMVEKQERTRSTVYPRSRRADAGS